MLHTNLSQNSTRTAAWKWHSLLSLCFLLLGLLLSMNAVRAENEALAGRLAPSLLRFHILANSDSKEDQQVKLEVRSLVLDYVKKHLPKDAGKADTIRCLTDNQAEIEALADHYLKKRGFDYSASLELTNCYFPSRTYDGLTFPSGYYDAARILLGKGEGHNWWCVLYPRFCFVDAACKAVPEESRIQLKAGINEDDYLALKQDNRPEITFRFRLFPSVTLRQPGL